MEAVTSRRLSSLPGRRVTTNRSVLPSTVRIAGTALLVAVVYYLGARVGEQLRFLPVTTSVMWPPNAILTATLLLTRPRWWGIYLLAAFPAHLLGQPAARELVVSTGSRVQADWMRSRRRAIVKVVSQARPRGR